MNRLKSELAYIIMELKYAACIAVIFYAVYAIGQL